MDRRIIRFLITFNFMNSTNFKFLFEILTDLSCVSLETKNRVVQNSNTLISKH